MQHLTKNEAEQKFPGVEFAGEVWIGGNVQIGGGVSIGSGVRISSNVQIGGGVSIGGGMIIGIDAIIGDGVWVGSNVRIGSNVQIGGGVSIGGGTIIGIDAIIGDGAVVGRNVRIGDGTRVGSDVSIGSGVVVGAFTRIVTETIVPTGAHIPRSLGNVTAALAINGIGKHKQLSAIACDKGLIIHIGCMNDYQGLPPDGAREEIAKKYEADHPYFAAIDLAERWYEGIE